MQRFIHKRPRRGKEVLLFEQKTPPSHVSFLLDESASMVAIENEILSGLNEYLSALAHHPVASMASVNVTKFNSLRITEMINGEAAHRLGQIAVSEFNPRGRTPLYDAIRRVILAMDEQTYGEFDSTVVIAILTDGMENASTNASKQLIQAMIAEREARGWHFLYFGANQDAWSEARDMGISRGRASSFHATPADASRAMYRIKEETLARLVTVRRSRINKN